MESKRKSQYTAAEMEKRQALIDYLSNELSVETLTSCTTQFLSDLADFVENYGFDD